MLSKQVSASSCLCALPGFVLATFKGSILIDHILPPAEEKKNDDSEKCYRRALAGGPLGSTKLLFPFCPSLANTSQWKTSLSKWHPALPTRVDAAWWWRNSLLVPTILICSVLEKDTRLFSKTGRRRNVVLCGLPDNSQLLWTIEKSGSTSLGGMY